MNKFIGDKARKVELAQSSIFPFGRNKILNIRVCDVECAHLCTPPTPGRRHRKAHGIKDIHEGHRSRGVGAGATDKGSFGSQGGKFVTNTAARFQRETSLVDS